MTKEKPLSDKIEKEGNSTWGLKEGFVDTEDLKQAIKELKEELMTEGIYGDRDYTIMTINKIFGDKLT